jgi:hypothetical protein
MAAANNCAVLLIRHLAKAAYGNAIYKGIGSIDIVAAARSVLRAGINPHAPDNIRELLDSDGEVSLSPNEDRFVFVHSKCNISKKGPAVAYSIRDGKIRLKGPVLVSLADLQRGSIPRPAKQTASAFLLEQLANGPKPATELFATANSVGISETTLRRAAREMGIKPAPAGFRGKWQWALMPTAAAKQPGQLHESGCRSLPQRDDMVNSENTDRSEKRIEEVNE